ncbi:MAG: 4-hydroxy-tetrahydrodipicolinate reductase [Flavobacterium sp.]|nr:4-hydroxy-tetrahydrodipicolinate reductase [Flavobacterium sp.]
MKIALLGYGKMGQVIERFALSRGHEIVLKKDNHNTFLGLLNADVAIDFSVPDAAFANIEECLKNGIPVISGTTGWLNDIDKIENICTQNNGSFIYSSNFSLGVNLFFQLNQTLARMMKNFVQYHVSMEEIHHTQKLDSPSGTAISLANQIIANSDYTSWSETPSEKDTIHITAKREPNVPGTHSIAYVSDVDTIEIKHTAHSRDGFALGAVVAAEWLINKKGIYTMQDVLAIN